MNKAPIKWREWNPGLDTDHLTLGQLRDTLPGNNPEEISFIVKLLENPNSPIALTGAVTLARHDCIHIVLGRGLLNQDEAFVIGFTMGTAGEELKRWEEWLFRQVSMRFYPKIYRFSREHMKAFALGLRAGKESGVKHIYDYPLEEWNHRTLKDIRAELGLDTHFLRQIYKEEQLLLPASPSSLRLG